MERTLIRLLEDSATAYSDNPYLWEKRNGSYQETTYRETRELVYQFAAGLIHLGVNPGDRIALLSEGRNEWVISELGILYCGAINVPISVKIKEAGELVFRLSHAGCRFIIVSDSQFSTIQSSLKDLPDVERIICLDSSRDSDPHSIHFNEVMEMGREFLANQPEELESRYKQVKETDPANICYTSGTTSDPKGVVLTQLNYFANVEQGSKLLPIPEDYRSLLILPWDHSFAHTCGIYILMRNGASLASVEAGRSVMETLKNIPINIREIQPTFLLSVPALAQNFRKNIEKGIRQQGPSVERLFSLALKCAYTYNGNGWNRGTGLRRLLKPLVALFDRILFSKIRQGFGGRLRFFIGGGALLDYEMQQFFYAIGLPMYQGYGLTEAAPVISANVQHRHKLGSSGSIVDGLQVRICDGDGVDLPVESKGEIVVKGENVMWGYWANPAATEETMQNGWLFTGDLGYIDEDGFLYVLGREKSLLISSDGEKFSPEGIEEAILSHSPYLDQMMLFNNQSPYTVALVVPNRDALSTELHTKGLSLESDEGCRLAVDYLWKACTSFKQGGAKGDMFPSKWLPSTIAVLEEGFTEENRLMNNTSKMVRNRIAEVHRGRIEQLFTPQGRALDNEQNLKALRRTGAKN